MGLSKGRLGIPITKRTILRISTHGICDPIVDDGSTITAATVTWVAEKLAFTFFEQADATLGREVELRTARSDATILEMRDLRTVYPFGG